MKKVLNDFIQKFAALLLVLAMSLTPCITGMGQVFADEPEGDGDATYGLDIKESEHGKVEIKDSDQTSFKENDEVTLSVTPDDNYELEKLAVLSEDGTEVTSATEGSEFTFTMPAANLSVEASFVEKAKETADKEVTEWVKCELSVQGNGIVAIYDEDDFSAEYHFVDGKMYDADDKALDDQTVKVPKDKDLEICFVPDDNYSLGELSLKTSKDKDVDYSLDQTLPSSDTSTMECKLDKDVTLKATFVALDQSIGGMTEKEIEAYRDAIKAYYFGDSDVSLASAGDSVQLNCSTGSQIAYEGYSTNIFSVAGNAGWCLQPARSTPYNGTYTAVELDNNSALAKAMYYSVGAPGHAELSASIGSEGFWQMPEYSSGYVAPYNTRYAYCHMFLSWIYNNCNFDAAFYGTSLYNDPQLMAELKSDFEKKYDVVVNWKDIPSGFKAYVLNTGGYSQEIGGWTYTPTGKLSLKKEASNQWLVQDNPNYSLAGAEYGVYKDEDRTQKVATLTTDENGNTGTVELDAGTYYVAEEKASKGYKTDDNVYTVTVTSSQTATVTSTEVPSTDPMGITLTKIDQDSNGTANVKSLEGAQFEVKYYAVNSDDYNSAADLDGIDATRTWVLETKYVDGQYKAEFDDEYKVSGDDFYYDDSDNKCLPIGVITVEEITAPEGYKKDGATFTSETMTGPVEGKYFSKVLGNEEDIHLDGGNEYTVSDKSIRGGIKVAKWDNETNSQEAQGDATIGGATIEIVNKNDYDVVVDGQAYGKDQTVMTLTTDEEGNAQTASDALPYGLYEVKESGAPEGYKNEGSTISQEVFISEDGVIVDLNNDTNAIKNNVIRGGVKIAKWDKETNAQAAQGDATLDGATFEIVSQNSKNVVVNGTSYSKGEVVATISTEGGVAQTSDTLLPYGTYTITETNAPTGYLNKGTNISQTFKIRETGVIVDLTGDGNAVKNDVIRGGVKIAKWDKETNSQAPQGDATLEGATFAIISQNSNNVIVNGKTYKKGETVATIKTDKNGNVQTAKDLLPYGTYTLKETTAPTGYLNKGTNITQTFTIRENGKIVDLNKDATAVKNDVIRGGIKIAKWDNEFNAQTPQGDATLEGATFAIISQNSNNVIVNGKTYKKGETVATIKTDKDGNVQTAKDLLPYGTYTLKETTAPTGYLNKGTNITQTFTIRENGKIVDLNKDATAVKNNVIRGGVKLGKWDIEANAQIALGGATLEGAEFTITNESAHSVIVNGKTYKKGEVITTLTTNKKGIAETANNLLPYGTYSYKETKPPKGYNATGSGLSGTFKIRENGVIVDLNNDKSAIKNDVIRGDIYFSKADEETSDRMANIPFKITSNTTGESHTIMTDENGYFASSSDFNKHSQDTNGGKATSGLWFGLGADGKNVKVNDKKGALPYDTYTLEELRCDANKDKVLYKGTFTVSREAYEIDLGTIVNPDLTLSTILKDEETNSHYSQVSDDVTLIDTATYTGLKKNKEYVITGILMDKDTGEPALDPAGNQITATRTFKPKTAEGTVEVEYAFDASNMAGKTLVAYETVTLDGEEIVPDNDINNLDQTIYFPGVKTTALGQETKDHISKADEETVIVDTVEYSGLRIGKKYTVEGTLMDKETGKAVLDNDGKEITASETFKADRESGTIDITFKFNGSNLKGKTVVAFETILYKNKEYATHADITDTDQTIHFPEIGTTAADVKTNTGLALAEKDMTITDKVEYKNLLVGKEYTVKGTLMNKDTGKALEINGVKVTAEKTFTAESENGTVDLSFTFDGSALAGETLVVFENLYYNGVSVAVHKDLKDENQTVHIPEIGTTAKSDKTGINVNKAEKDVTLVDTVKYENLIPGKEYTVDGKLMDKETGKAFVVNGKEVTASAKFTPEKANGTIDITFKFDGTGLEEKSVVAFETVSYEGHEVAVHTDIKDEGQTVHFPKIKTTALDEKTEDHIGKADEKMTIVDTVKYTNLVKDKEYTVSGTLMDKETGKAIVDKDGKEVTASTTFTAEKANGTVDIVFTFDSSLLAGKTIVAFEDVSYKGVSVGTHADLTDEDQTVYIPKIHTTAIDDESQTKNSFADGMISITDTVTYENLIPGKEYTLKGTLKDQTTGETVVAKIAKTGEIPEGATAITFNEGTYAYVAKGTDTVAAGLYEKTEAGYVLSGTTDVVDLPEDLITWGGNFDGPGVGYVKDGEVTVLDYTFTESAEEVVAEKTFTPTEANGTVDLTFVFDGSEMAGQTFVVFEDVYYKNVNVATHSDLTDEDQTIYVPEIKTSAKDEASNSQNALASKETTIVDTVNYTNLIPGKEYTVKGKLYDKKTKEALLVDGKEVTSETTFTPESASGSIDMTFKFDSSALKNQTVVVFEDLYIGDKQVATHSDINDKDQSIYFPEIKTTATDKSDGDHEAYATSNVTITDAVKYENLLPGTSYKVEGTLMDKETGKAVLVNGKEVKAEATFTPEESSGTVNVDFTFDASNLGGKSVVVFEKLYTAEGKEIANHEDINDEGQTVKLVTPPKTTTVQTGDTFRMYGLIAGAVVLVVIGGCIFFKKSKKKDNKDE